ncbi:hypothetical protein D3C85_1522850 [compost metagenome]
MEFVENEIEIRIFIACQPFSRLFEDRIFDFARQHSTQHGGVGHEDVRRRGMNVPARDHLTAVDRREDIPRFVV